ncbi:MAG: Predicted N6-adenine-specific RNA methylase containing THUMP domain, partial [uncultured Nocardioidaceae bacterium]
GLDPRPQAGGPRPELERPPGRPAQPGVPARAGRAVARGRRAAAAAGRLGRPGRRQPAVRQAGGVARGQRRAVPPVPPRGRPGPAPRRSGRPAHRRQAALPGVGAADGPAQDHQGDRGGDRRSPPERVRRRARPVWPADRRRADERGALGTAAAGL